MSVAQKYSTICNLQLFHEIGRVLRDVSKTGNKQQKTRKQVSALHIQCTCIFHFSLVVGICLFIVYTSGMSFPGLRDKVTVFVSRKLGLKLPREPFFYHGALIYNKFLN